MGAKNNSSMSSPVANFDTFGMNAQQLKVF